MHPIFQAIALLSLLLFGRTTTSWATPPPEPPVMILVKGGCFQMGCGPWAGDCDPDETPAHTVCLDDFLLMDHEVTAGEYRAFVSETGYRPDSYRLGGCFRWTGFDWEKDPSLHWDDPGFPQDERHPAVCLTLKDAMKYAAWLSSRSRILYRLPTEAEWEYAARSGGRELLYDWGSGTPQGAGNVSTEETRRSHPAWPWPVWPGVEDGFIQTAPVKSFHPNALGLYDMSGNVAEWSADRYDAGTYTTETRNNPAGPDEGLARVVRGGSWLTPPRFSRTTDRRPCLPWGRSTHLGFRLAATPEKGR